MNKNDIYNPTGETLPQLKNRVRMMNWDKAVRTLAHRGYPVWQYLFHKCGMSNRRPLTAAMFAIMDAHEAAPVYLRATAFSSNIHEAAHAGRVARVARVGSGEDRWNVYVAPYDTKTFRFVYRAAPWHLAEAIARAYLLTGDTGLPHDGDDAAQAAAQSTNAAQADTGKA